MQANTSIEVPEVKSRRAEMGGAPKTGWHNVRYELVVVLLACAIFLVAVASPPPLLDDVDAAQAQLARNMLTSGDWVSGRLDGVLFLDKAPLKYWLSAVSYMIFGVHDWAARTPTALAAVLLCWVAVRMGRWAFSEKAGFYAGLVLVSCVGLFLFTRIIIPDVILTLSITLSIWGFLRAIDDEEPHPRLWAWVFAAGCAAGVLLKGMIGVVFPMAAAFVYLLVTRHLFDRQMWRRLHPFTGALIFLAIAAPWHVLAIIRNPPYFDFTMHARPGEYRGFFWSYFINEHVLRFLNERYPRDYATVPRPAFWLLNLVWLFPWSACLAFLGRVSYRKATRAGRMRLMALCWTGVVMLFFTFSTTQEYYSMPVYPAMALLFGSVMAVNAKALKATVRTGAGIAAGVGVILTALLAAVWNKPAPGDISRALTANPDAYTLSLGHLRDLTLNAFAYLRLPMGIAAAAFLVGSVLAFRFRRTRSVIVLALMMGLFFHAARMALGVFGPYMSSEPVARTLAKLPKGRLIEAGGYYAFSALFFYTDYNALLLNGRFHNLEYGSYAPGAPHVFIGDEEFRKIWAKPELAYLAISDSGAERIAGLVGRDRMIRVASAGGKSIFANQPVQASGSEATALRAGMGPG